MTGLEQALQHLFRLGDQLTETQRKQKERFAEDFARIYASEQSAPDDEITDYTKIRGE